MVMYPRREGLKNIAVNETVEIKVGQVGINKFNQRQVSGFVGDKYYFLPTHVELVDQLLRVPEGEVVKVKRLTAGNEKEAAKYEVKTEGSESSSSASDDAPYEQMMNTVVSCLKNNIPTVGHVRNNRYLCRHISFIWQ